MKIFMTGATGYIGSRLAGILASSGHVVWGLARNEDKASYLVSLGVRPVLGDFKKVENYFKTAADCDILIHLGLEAGPGAASSDMAALQNLLLAADASGKRRLFIYTSGVWVLGDTGSAEVDETAPARPLELVAWRPEHEAAALAAAQDPLSVVVVRPGCVYGGRGGLYGAMFDSALRRGMIKLAGGGENHWAAVGLDDLVDLYLRILLRRPEKALYHATDGGSESLRDVARAFLKAAGKGGEPEAWPLESARQALGPFADALALNQRVSSAKARRELDWKPQLRSAAQNAARLLVEWKGTPVLV